MAFLDNSGDIILDAVLTEEGRRAMSNGTFQISKFALGDDEINYKLYDKSHPSGSAYFDLEILQTPVLEATTAINAHINYGLMSIANPNLLYMPTIKKNELIDQAILMQDNVYYLAVRDGVTYDALVTGFGGTKGGGTKKVLKANGRNNNEAIILETGLDTGEIAATAANRNTYILSMGLTDAALSVAVDTRFLSTVLGPGGNDKFANIAGTGESDTSFKLVPVQPSKNDRTKRFYSQAGIRTVANNVFHRTGDTKADTATSVIAGPRASATAIGFDHRTLSTEAFSRHGKTGQSISGASGTYKYIDTTVYVYAATGIVHQIPLRIIQKE